LNPATAAVLFTAAMAAAALGSALGMAGGIFVVPLLTTYMHTSFSTSVAVSLVSVVACSCASAPQFLSARLTNMRLAVVLETATVSGSFAAVALLGLLTNRLLYLLFAVTMVISAWQMFAGREAPTRPDASTASSWGTRLRLHASYPGAQGQGAVTYWVNRLPLGLTLMFGAGLLSALLGIGSGVLKIPAMDSALRLPVKVSSATANLMIGVTAAGSAAAHLLHGDLRLDLAAPITLGSVAGAICGAPVLTRLPSSILRAILILVLLALAGVMTVQALRVGA
jgi:uncharacterized protein